MTRLLSLLAVTLVASVAAVNAGVTSGQLKDGGKVWALLVAGSSGYYNYRHQADVAHAYQILKKNKIPAENVIVMMYDDVASDSENPTPNQLINRPNGPDVYSGIQIDYRNTSVTPANFLAVLSGNASAVNGQGNGRVIESGPNDVVFVNFVDHGGSGILGFPDDLLYASDLESTLSGMADGNQFSKLFMYVEACEAGSMFDGLLSSDKNIYVMTASNAEESSYACYWDDERQAYLGDVYSVKWMEDSEGFHLFKETVAKQYSKVQGEVTDSHVEEYGDLTLAKLPVSTFQGSHGWFSAAQETKSIISDAVDSRHVPVSVLFNKMLAASSDDEASDLFSKIEDLLTKRQYLEQKVDEIAERLAQEDADLKDRLVTKYRLITSSTRQCYESLVRNFHDKCFHLTKNPHATTQLHVLINACHEMSAATANEAIESVCGNMEKVTDIL